MADRLRFVAVDWSGRATGAAAHLWVAEARVGAHGPELVRLECGRTREEVVDHLVGLLADRRRSGDPVVGIDFSFSLPDWWLAEQGFDDGPGLWTAAAEHGERWLAECEPPFWGRPGRPKPAVGEQFRVTERALRVGGILPKPTFQIGGAGAVGTGSVRGWPHLRRLRDAGYAVWPFDAPAQAPLAVEVWPRLCTGPLVKSDPDARAAHTGQLGDSVASPHRDLMRSSEDAFDAGCTALVMAAHATALTHLGLPDGADPAVVRREGWVWTPPLSPRRPGAA